MRKRTRFTLVGAMLTAACGTTPRDDAEATASARSAGEQARFPGITPRAVKPVFTPIGLRTEPIKVMVELEGDPITIVQSQVADRKLTAAEKNQVRDSLRSRQSIA